MTGPATSAPSWMRGYDRYRPHEEPTVVGTRVYELIDLRRGPTDDRWRSVSACFQ
jgi:hypothetical protein